MTRTSGKSRHRGWSLAERRSWDGLPSLREPYAAADLAESLLSDADSLLAILAAAGSYEVRGDTVHFGNAELAAAFRAQRARIADRSGPPVSDPDLRPTLTQVRRSIAESRSSTPEELRRLLGATSFAVS